MGLITCPDCGKEISDKASACPNCGCPVGKPTTDTSGKKKDSVLSVIALVLSIFVITSFLGIIVGLIDLGAFSKDGKRHIGSWFAVILGVALLILTKGRIFTYIF